MKDLWYPSHSARSKGPEFVDAGDGRVLASRVNKRASCLGNVWRGQAVVVAVVVVTGGLMSKRTQRVGGEDEGKMVL